MELEKRDCVGETETKERKSDENCVQELVDVSIALIMRGVGVGLTSLPPRKEGTEPFVGDTLVLPRDHRDQIAIKNHARAISADATLRRVLYLSTSLPSCKLMIEIMMRTMATPTKPWYLTSRTMSRRLLSRGFVALRLIFVNCLIVIVSGGCWVLTPHVEFQM